MLPWSGKQSFANLKLKQNAFEIKMFHKPMHVQSSSKDDQIMKKLWMTQVSNTVPICIVDLPEIYASLK